MVSVVVALVAIFERLRFVYRPLREGDNSLLRRECVVCWSVDNYRGRPIDHIRVRRPYPNEARVEFRWKANRPEGVGWLTDRQGG
jgi:hypothetical protein